MVYLMYIRQISEVVPAFAKEGKMQQEENEIIAQGAAQSRLGYALAPSALFLQKRVGMQYLFRVYNARKLRPTDLKKLISRLKISPGNMLADNRIILAINAGEVGVELAADMDDIGGLPKLVVKPPPGQKVVNVVVIGGQHRIHAHQAVLKASEDQLTKYKERLSELRMAAPEQRGKDHEASIALMKQLIEIQEAEIDANGWWVAEIHDLSECITF